MEGYFAVETKSKKRLLSVIGLLAIIGVVAIFEIISGQAKTLAIAQLQIEEQEFVDFISKFNKQYISEEEYAHRFKIFRDNSAYIRVANTQGNTHYLGINQFSDLTNAEFKTLYTPHKYQQILDIEIAEFDLTDDPATVDWSLHGAVTPVKNQGQCGADWAFSTTGSTESAWFIAGHALTSLSEQQLVDCSRSYGNNGCSGGTVEAAIKYIIANGGITTEANYPYTGNDGVCNTTQTKPVGATLKGLKQVQADSTLYLFTAVAKQPVSVAVEADQASWKLYKGGIVSGDCGTNLDHSVLIVGYSQVSSPPYWKVKNSWGESWGEAGYIRIAAYGGKGVCGINMQPIYPIV